jgi:hypothetical protein
MSKGEQIYIQDDLDGWYRIEPVAESFGWVSEKFLKLKSNDLSSHPKTPPRKFINKEEAQQEPVLGERQMVEDTPADDLPAAMNKGVVSFTGTVESYEDAGADGIYYKIVAGGQIVCYIQGVNHMLGRFVHQQVSIDGTANSKLRPQYPYPVIAVLKVRLIL